jgi:hypothetical protein
MWSSKHWHLQRCCLLPSQRPFDHQLLSACRR